jgi:hypothetical protein
MTKGLLIYEEIVAHFLIYYRKPFLIYDFATAPLWISLHMRKILFSFFISASMALAGNSMRKEG